MIRGQHTCIRATDPDDARYLAALYDAGRPRAALLDNKREPLLPNLEELQEVLTRKEAAQNLFFTIENRAGEVLGFTSLRGLNPELSFGELYVLLDEAEYAGPAAREAFEFMRERAFTRLRLNKVVAFCLAREQALRAFLLSAGFTSSGTQRDVFYSQGHWHDFEMLSLFAAQAQGA